jgi:hypothetical protein
MTQLRLTGIILLLMYAAFAVSSCEEILDADGLPYEEKLVIHGILFADSTNNLIQISRTLPLNVRFDTTVAYLKDAQGTISDGEKSYPLESIGYSGKYRAVGLIPARGTTYNLHVSWHGLNARATTQLPAAGIVDTALIAESEEDFGFDEYVITSKLKLPQSTSALIGVSPIGDASPYMEFDYRLYGETHAKDDGFVYTKTRTYKNNENTITGIWIRLHTFAPGYYEYVQSKNSDSFEELGNPAIVRWNVSGDAIGIFFGCTVSESTITF